MDGKSHLRQSAEAIDYGRGGGLSHRDLGRILKLGECEAVGQFRAAIDATIELNALIAARAER